MGRPAMREGRSRRAAVLRRGAAALLLLAGGACTTARAPDFAPLLRVEPAPGGAVEIEALGPLLAARSGPEGFSHALRPLYQHKAAGAQSVTDALPPLGRVFTDRSGTTFRFWPLVWAGEMDDSAAGRRWGAIVFPLIAAGDGPADDDGYFAVFPLAGTTRNVLGVDRFDFVLWPLWMRTEISVREPGVSTSLLLLFGWTSGGPRDGSWRALPFWRHRVWREPDGTLRTDQHTALWPFFTWGGDALQTDDPVTRHAFWPFYGWESNASWFRLTLLWPFFRFQSATPPPDVDAPDAFLYDFPWPLLRLSHGPEGSVVRCFPFYSRQTTEQVDSRSFLWPLGWRRHDVGRTEEQGRLTSYERSTLSFIPLLHAGRRTLATRAEPDTHVQVWPFFHDEQGSDGRIDRAFPSLIPFRHTRLMRPLDEVLSPWLTLWRRRSDGARDERRLLLDTVLWRRESEGLRVSVPLLWSRRPQAGGGARHQTLWGLFGWDTDAEGLCALNLAGWTAWRR